MTLEEFKEFHIALEKSPLLYQDSRYEAYIDLIYSSQELCNWVLQYDMEEKGFEYKEYCCLVMAKHVSDSLDENQEIQHDNHDVIMNKWKDGTFGIPIHDGGSSVVEINFCPWCGENIKKNE